MKACLAGGSAVSQWYLTLEGECIVGGMGVIDNDFHNRRDLTPNVCAVYTEADRRGRGIAGALLQLVCDDMRERGIRTLYLLTDHTAFYERYGWEFLCMVQGGRRIAAEPDVCAPVLSRPDAMGTSKNGGRGRRRTLFRAVPAAAVSAFSEKPYPLAPNRVRGNMV